MLREFREHFLGILCLLLLQIPIADAAGSVFGESIQRNHWNNIGGTGRKGYVSPVGNIHAAIHAGYYCAKILTQINSHVGGGAGGGAGLVNAQTVQEGTLYIHSKLGPIYVEKIDRLDGTITYQSAQIWSDTPQGRKGGADALSGNPRYTTGKNTVKFDTLFDGTPIERADTNAGRKLVLIRLKASGLDIPSLAIHFIEGEVKDRKSLIKDGKYPHSLKLWDDYRGIPPIERAQRIYAETGDDLLRAAVLRSFNSKGRDSLSNFMEISPNRTTDMQRPEIRMPSADIHFLAIRDFWDSGVEGLGTSTTTASQPTFSLLNYIPESTGHQDDVSRNIFDFKSDSSEEKFDDLLAHAPQQSVANMDKFFGDIKLRFPGREIILVPIPSKAHTNSTGELAEHLGGRYKMKVEFSLLTAKSVGRQVEQEGLIGRLINFGQTTMPYALRAEKTKPIIILVDDIETSGATFEAAKRQLFLQQNVEAVFSFALGKTTRP